MCGGCGRTGRWRIVVLGRQDTSREEDDKDDDRQDDNDDQCQQQSHLGVLPPHLALHPLGSLLECLALKCDWTD